MPLPLLTTPETTVINKVDYNTLRSNIEQILGLGDNSYGFTNFGAVPVTARNQITTSQWALLLADINLAHRHIFNVNTATSVPTTSTVLSAAYVNEINDLINNRIDPNKYFIAEEQYFVDPATGSSIINTDADSGIVQGLSTSTNTVWYGSMTHIVRMGFFSEEICRYFFNTGGKLVWNTFYDVTSGETSADSVWADFIKELVQAANRPATNIYEYGRTKYLAGNDTQTYTNSSGTVSITVSVEQTQGRLFKFTAVYQDLKPGNLELTPSGYTWRY